LALPNQAERLWKGYQDGVVHLWSILVVLALFVVATWFIVYFTTAQRRIPIQHMRRTVGTRMMGGQTSYLPLSVNMAGVMPLIFFFTYFWTAIQYNVEDISNNLKRGGSFIPGVRPGKQTKDFLDGVISRITVVGAAFISVVALLQYISPRLAAIPPQQVNII